MVQPANEGRPNDHEQRAAHTSGGAQWRVVSTCNVGDGPDKDVRSYTHRVTHEPVGGDFGPGHDIAVDRVHRGHSGQQHKKGLADITFLTNWNAHRHHTRRFVRSCSQE